MYWVETGFPLVYSYYSLILPIRSSVSFIITHTINPTHKLSNGVHYYA